MANDLSNEERETNLNMTGDDHTVWIVFTDDPFWMRRLDGVAELLATVGQGKRYRLDANQVTVRARPKPLSDERKAQLAQQLRSLPKTSVATGVLGGKEGE